MRVHNTFPETESAIIFDCNLSYLRKQYPATGPPTHIERYTIPPRRPCDPGLIPKDRAICKSMAGTEPASKYISALQSSRYMKMIVMSLLLLCLLLEGEEEGASASYCSSSSFTGQVYKQTLGRLHGDTIDSNKASIRIDEVLP